MSYQTHKCVDAVYYIKLLWIDLYFLKLNYKLDFIEKQKSTIKLHLVIP